MTEITMRIGEARTPAMTPLYRTYRAETGEFDEQVIAWRDVPTIPDGSVHVPLGPAYDRVRELLEELGAKEVQ